MDNVRELIPKVEKEKENEREKMTIVEEVGTQKELATLYSKMARIMGKVGTIEKRGYNSYNNYDYATAEDIKEAIRPLCAEENIWISSHRGDYKKNIVKTKNGTSMEVELDMYFTIRCGDTGAKITLLYSGYAIDKGDKFLYKAYTGAMKYFLINNFMLSAGDDPEMDSPEIEEDANIEEKNIETKETPKKTSKVKSKHINTNLKTVRDEWKKNPELVQEIAYKYLESLGKEKDISLLSELKDNQLEEILNRIKETNSQEEVLATK